MDIALAKEIFEICIIPLLGVLTTYLVKLIKKKSAEIDAQLDDTTLQKYNQILADTITECVIATNQTFVDTLKEKGAFTKEAQTEAFKLTYNKIMNILTDEAKAHLKEAYGDLNVYISTKIEAEVNLNKEA